MPMMPRKMNAYLSLSLLAGVLTAAFAQTSAPEHAPACCGAGTATPPAPKFNGADYPYSFVFVEKKGGSVYRTVAVAQVPQTDYFYLTHNDGTLAWRLSGACEGPPNDRDLGEYAFSIQNIDGNERAMSGNGIHVGPGKTVALPSLSINPDSEEIIFLFRRAAPDAPELTQAEIAGAVNTANAMFKDFDIKKIRADLAKRAKDAPKAPPPTTQATAANPAMAAFRESPARAYLEDYSEFAEASDKTAFAVQALEELLNAPQSDSLPYLFKLQQLVVFIRALPRAAVEKADMPAWAYHLTTNSSLRPPQLPVGGASLEALQKGTLEHFAAPEIKDALPAWKSLWQKEGLFLFAQQQAADLQGKLPPGWYVANLQVVDTGKRLYVADAAALAVEADKPARVSARIGDTIFTFEGSLPSREIEGCPKWGEFSLENLITKNKRTVRTNVSFSKTPTYTGGSLSECDDDTHTRRWDYFFVLHVPPGPRLTLIWAERPTKGAPYRIVFSHDLPTRLVFSKGQFVDGKLLSISTSCPKGSMGGVLHISANVSDPKTQAQSHISTKFMLGGKDGLFALGGGGAFVVRAQGQPAQENLPVNAWLIRRGEAPLPTSADIERAMAATIP